MSKLFNLYLPGLKPGYIICALYPFLAYLIAVIAAKNMEANINWLVEDPTFLLLCASPLMLTKRDRRAQCATLDVSVSQKISFLLLNFWVIVPAIIFLSLYISELFCYLVFDYTFTFDFFVFVSQEDGLFFTFSQFITIYTLAISIITIVLYYVVKAKKNRVLAGLISCIVATIVTGVFAALGDIILVKSNVCELSDPTSDGAFNAGVMCCAVPVMVIIGIIYLIKLYKRLDKCGF